MKKTMKRSLAVILAMLMLMSAVPFTSFAAKDDCPYCKPASKLVEITAVQATCTEGGNIACRKCNRCNKYFDANKNEITDISTPATGHAEEAIPAVPATCTTAGKTAGVKCSVCDAVITEQEDVAASGHNFGEWQGTTPPTCTTVGVKTRTCKNANCTASETGEIAATGHTAVTDPAVAPGCTTKGKTEGSHCSVCQAVITEQEDVAASGHNFGDWTVKTAATCTTAGEETRICADCDVSEVRPIATTDVHTYGEWTVKTAATCTTNGEETRKCAYCDVSEVRPIVATGSHTFGEWTETTAATCTVAGVETRTCSACDFSETNEIPATGHDDPAGVEWSYPAGFDCTVGGKQVKLCHCGEQLAEAEEAVPPTTHINVNIPSNPATCSTEGNTLGMKCFVCDTVIIPTTVISAKGHKIGETLEIVDAVEAECTKDGNIEHYRCKDCEGYFVVGENSAITEVQAADVVAPKLNHSDSRAVEAQAPTCSEKGHTEGFICNVCGETVSGCEEQPALGHAVGTNLELQAAVAAKCDATGKEEHYTCKDCKKLFVEDEDGEFVETTEGELTIPVRKHTPAEALTNKTDYLEETCTVNGNYEYYTCADCGKFFVEEEAEDGKTYSEITQEETIIPAGHKYEIVEEDSTRATCSEDGTIYEKCSVCNNVIDRVESATGHTWSEEWTEDKEASCTEEGEKSFHCANCEERKDITPIPKKDHAYDIIEIPVECTQDGKRTYDCMVCGDHKEEILKADGRHTDIDSNGICDVCHQQSCDCMCHKDNFFYKLIYWICKIWWQYLGINETCACGAVHYSKSVF